MDDQIRNLDKKITIHHRPPFSNIINDLDFRYLYSLGYDFSEGVKGNFNRYLDQSVLFGGTVLGEGIGSRTNDNEYIRLKTTNKVDLKYQVKESLAKITKVDSRTGTLTNGSKIVSINPTGSIEIGNYVFGTNIPEETTVDDIQTNSYIILSKAATGTGTNIGCWISEPTPAVRSTWSDPSPTRESPPNPSLSTPQPAAALRDVPT